MTGGVAIPRLVVAAMRSGSGKTTVCCALAAALAEAGLRVQPFKAGPDYIDAGHLGWAAGREAGSLDTWLLGERATGTLFRRRAAGADLALVEGVMGLLDGRGPRPGAPGSSADLARVLDAPVALVLDARGAGPTVAAWVAGMRSLAPTVRLAGVILNRVSGPSHADLLREALASLPGPPVPVLGALRRDPALEVPERSLGLATWVELGAEAEGRRRHLAAWAREGLDLEAILRLARRAPSMSVPAGPDPMFPGEPAPVRRRLAIARDAAFQFYYPDSLDVLAWHGVEWVPFSPLADAALPAAVEGVCLGGGFPERHLEALAANTALAADLRRRAPDLDLYAECGGMMYLCRRIEEPDGRPWPMAGLLPATVRVGARRAALGYREAVASGTGLFLQPGDRLRGHEFHYSTADGLPADAAAYRLTDSRGRTRPDGFARGRHLAGYLHLHFAAHPELAARWAKGGSPA
jgi:cobyrinic acid a,c-diamide synthase